MHIKSFADAAGLASLKRATAKGTPARQVKARKPTMPGDSIGKQTVNTQMKPLIITVAPLGAELGVHDTPHLPYTREAFADTAVACAKAGAAILHVHCRTEDGANTHAVERFAEISGAVKAKCADAGVDLIQQYSTGGSVEMTPAERSAPLRLNPEMATLSCGTLNFGDDVFQNPWPMMLEFAQKMRGRNVVPELELFDLGHLDTAKRLVAKEHLMPLLDESGNIKRPIHVDFVLGVPGGAAGTQRHLEFLVEELPKDWSWSVAGIGRAELELAKLAITMGGHVRVGLEDNIYLEKGVYARNEELVARIARISQEHGRPVASAAQAREMLGIDADPKTRYVETAA